MTTIVTPSFLKQKARQIKKEKSIKQNQALDEAAIFFGFSNYRHYLNVLDDINKRKELLFKDIFSELDMLKKADLAVSFLQTYTIPFHEQLDIIKLFEHSNIVGQHPKTLQKFSKSFQATFRSPICG